MTPTPLGLKKVTKLPSDYLLQTSQGPQDKTSTPGPTPMLWQSDPAQLQPKPDPQSTSSAGPEPMTVFKNTKKGMTLDQVYTTLA